MIDPAIRRPLLADAVFSRLMDALTGGSFLAGLGLLVGADNLGLAVLASLPFLAQVAQLPAVAILLKWTDRRRIVLWTAGASRTLLLVIALLLVASPAAVTETLLIGVLGAAALLTVVATAAWNWWIRDLIPTRELGSFFGQRLRGATFATLGTILLAGAMLDRFIQGGHSPWGYAVLFGAGGLAGLLGLVALARTPHVRPPPSPSAAGSLRRIPLALKSAPRLLVTSLSMASVAATFALPFTAVYLLRGVGYSFLAVTTMAVTSQLAYLAGLRGWALISDKHGDRSLLSISMGILAFTMAGWSLAGWSAGPSLFAALLVLHFLAGFALGGIELASTNLLLRSAPSGNEAAHLAGISFVRAAASGVGVLAAGAIWQSIGAGVLWTGTIPGLGGWEFRGFQLLCVVSLGLCLAAGLAVARMQDPQGRRIVDVARAMRREVHQMSSVAGIRGLIHAVSYSVELMAWPFAARQARKDKPAPDEDRDRT